MFAPLFGAIIKLIKSPAIKKNVFFLHELNVQYNIEVLSSDLHGLLNKGIYVLCLNSINCF
jgi:hypothetical protein